MLDIDSGDNQELMDDWTQVPVFGACPGSSEWVLRASAYVLAIRDDGRLAIVRTSQGTFLPGGGIEGSETSQETIIRETLEECGLIIQFHAWAVRAIQFVYSGREKTHFEKRSTFRDGVIVGFDSTRGETDHELVWVKPEEATRILSHESQRWAVEQWQGRPSNQIGKD